MSTNEHKCISFTSMGQEKYISALNYVDVVAGNSSSGIIETGCFKVPTINIGDREKGRIMADNVICVEQSMESIKAGFDKALSSKFKKSIANMNNPYDKPDTAKNIATMLDKLEMPTSTEKEFYDLN